MGSKTTAVPHDISAEQAVLGAVLVSPAVMTDLVGRLNADDFYRPAHRILWQTLARMHAAGQPLDPVAVADELIQTGELGRIGGADYLHTLMQAVPTPSNAAYYAGIVADHARRRSVVDLGTRLSELARAGAPTADLLAAGRALLADADELLDWPPPIPFGDKRHLPTFPVHVLPSWVGNMVTAVADFTQTPIDLGACISLAALSTAAGGRAEVEVRGTWREPVNLFITVALPPGARKSPVFNAIIRPLLEAEKALAEQAGPAIVEATLAAKVARAAAERAANAAAATADEARRDELLAEASAAAAQAEAIKVPAKPRLVADDITSEQAASLLAEQGGRLAVLSAEGGIFATLAGRYSGTPNLEVFLKGHSGDMLRVDRRTREAEHVDRPALTLGLAVQPEVLREIAAMPGFRGKGLLARILFSVPENTVGRRRPDLAKPIPTDVADTYRANLIALVLSLAGWNNDPAILPLTPAADRRVLDIELEVEPRLAPGGAWSHIVDWGAKYTGAVVRIAGLLHLATHLRDGWGKPIDVDTIDAAATIGSYFAAHALAAFEDMGADPTTQHARHVLAWLRRTQTTRFTKRELLRAVRGTIPTVAALDPVLTLLELHGYIRATEPPARTGPGRPPAPTYLVHPDVIAPTAELRPLPNQTRKPA